MRHRSDMNGFTLVELLVASAIATLIITSLGTAIHQFITASERGNDKLRVSHDIQNAGYWLYQDGERAESTNLVDGAPPVSSMTLNWISESESNFSTYSRSGTELTRDHDGTILTVARHISSAEFSIAGKLITVSMTSAPAGRWGVSKPAVYKIWLRPTG